MYARLADEFGVRVPFWHDDIALGQVRPLPAPVGSGPAARTASAHRIVLGVLEEMAMLTHTLAAAPVSVDAFS